MRRGLALTITLSLMMVLWVADVAAKSSGGGFRSGNRATRDDGGSGFSSDQGSGFDQPSPDAPSRRRPPKSRTWYGTIRSLVLGGLIGGLFFGRGAAGLGLIEVLILSGLIVLAFRALSKYQTVPTGHYAGSGGYGGGLSDLGRAAGAAATALEDTASIERGVSGIRQADPTFGPAEFARTVDGAFRKVQAAWTARDLGRAADVLTAEMREKLQRECDRLKSSGRINRVENIALRRVAITEARQERGWDLVTVYIVATLVDYMTDEGGLKVVGGNPFEPVQFQERWRLIRPSGPNPWRVSAIH